MSGVLPAERGKISKEWLIQDFFVQIHFSVWTQTLYGDVFIEAVSSLILDSLKEPLSLGSVTTHSCLHLLEGDELRAEAHLSRVAATPPWGENSLQASQARASARL